MLEILKRIQTDVSGLKTDVSSLKTDVSGLKTDMADVKARLDRLETGQKKLARNSAALLVMRQGTVGVFDERVGNLEQEVRLILERE